MFKNCAKDEFTLTSRIARIHDFRHGFVLDEFQNGGELFFPTTSLGFVLKRFWNERQTVDRTPPIFEGIIVVVHVLEFKQVSDGPGDDDVLTVPVRVGFFAHTQHVGEVLRHAGFLSDDDDGHGDEAHRRPYLNPPLAS